MAHMLDQIAMLVLFASAWALGVWVAVMVTIGLIAVIEMSVDRWRK